MAFGRKGSLSGCRCIYTLLAKNTKMPSEQGINDESWLELAKWISWHGKTVAIFAVCIDQRRNYCRTKRQNETELNTAVYNHSLVVSAVWF